MRAVLPDHCKATQIFICLYVRYLRDDVRHRSRVPQKTNPT
jgi:hypothetical protein